MILKRDHTWSTWFKTRFAFLYSSEDAEHLRGGGMDIASQPVSASGHGDHRDMGKKKHLSIHPHSVLALVIAMLSGICLIYTVVFVPVAISFYFHQDLCEGTPYDTFDLIVETVFLLEICCTWFIGRYNKGHYLGSLQEIAEDYIMSGQLAFDCVTSLPIGWLEHSQRITLCEGKLFKDPGMDSYNVDPEGGAGEDMGDLSPELTGMLMLVKVIKPLRLLRLVRMLKLLNHKALKALKEHLGLEPDTIRLLTVVAGVFLSCHFVGALYWLVKSLSNSPAEVNEYLSRQGFERLWFCGKKLPDGYQPCEKSSIWYAPEHLGPHSVPLSPAALRHGACCMRQASCAIRNAARRLRYATLTLALSAIAVRSAFCRMRSVGCFMSDALCRMQHTACLQWRMSHARCAMRQAACCTQSCTVPTVRSIICMPRKRAVELSREHHSSRRGACGQREGAVDGCMTGGRYADKMFTAADSRNLCAGTCMCCAFTFQ